MSTAKQEIKDRYYFIDYLRLHEFGKGEGIWTKNRNMLVKEHEHTPNLNLRARKGYKSYIQRCVKSILEWLFPEFTIIKPRNVFGYEIGKKNDNRQGNEVLQFDDAEDRIKMIVQRNLANRSFNDDIQSYARAVNDTQNVSFKNRYSGLKITLDEKKSKGYPVIKSLLPIRKEQEKLIEKADFDTLFKKTFIDGLRNTMLLKKGQKVRIAANGRFDNTSALGTIEDVKLLQGNNGESLELRYEVQTVNGLLTLHSRQLKPITQEEAEELGDTSASIISEYVERIIRYANENFRNASGVSTSSVFNLSREAIAREIVNSGDVSTAAEVRRINPDSQMLNRISISQDILSEDEMYEEEDESECYECGEYESECICCLDCGSYPCNCYPEDEASEWDD